MNPVEYIPSLKFLFVQFFKIPFEPLELVEDELFHVLHLVLGLGVRPHPEDQHSLAVLVAAVVEQSAPLFVLVQQFGVLDICNRNITSAPWVQYTYIQ